MYLNRKLLDYTVIYKRIEIKMMNKTDTLGRQTNACCCSCLKVLGKSVGGENAKVPRYEVKW